MKRQRPLYDITEPREKIFVTERLVCEQDPNYMKEIYAKTKAMLFEGARGHSNTVSTETPVDEIMDSDCNEPSLKNNCDRPSLMQNNGRHQSPMIEFKDDRVITLIKGARRLPTPPPPIKHGNDAMGMSNGNLGMNMNEKNNGIRGRKYQQLHIDQMLYSKRSEAASGTEDGGKFNDRGRSFSLGQENKMPIVSDDVQVACSLGLSACPSDCENRERCPFNDQGIYLDLDQFKQGEDEDMMDL